MRYLLTLLLGVILGAFVVYYFLVGAPAAKPVAGSPIAAPDPNGAPPGTAVVTLDEGFFNTVLGSIFTGIGDPKFPLGGSSSDGCTNEITLKREGSGVQTAVRFVDGKITAPLAFEGNYNVPLVGCRQLRGWALANVNLQFDQQQQALNGVINVEGVNLEGFDPIAGNFVTPLVQNAINTRVNPLHILGASQLNLNVPVVNAGGTLQARVKDLRADINNPLRLYVTYDFTGSK